jgi:hypothetical protein
MLRATPKGVFSLLLTKIDKVERYFSDPVATNGLWRTRIVFAVPKVRVWIWYSLLNNENNN